LLKLRRQGKEHGLRPRAMVCAAVAMDRSPLQVLGLQPGADACSVRQAYRKLARQLHPDKVSAGLAEGPARDRKLQEATARFRELQAAYEALQSGARSAEGRAAPGPGGGGGGGGGSRPGAQATACPARDRSASRSRSPAPPSPCEEPADRKAVRQRAALLRRGGAVRAEAASAGVASASEGFAPASTFKGRAEAAARLLRYRQRLEATRLAPTDASLDEVRAALWDLDRTGVTVQMLLETGIGVELNKLFWRKHKAEDVAEMCQDLVQRWKDVFARHKAEVCRGPTAATSVPSSM